MINKRIVKAVFVGVVCAVIFLLIVSYFMPLTYEMVAVILWWDFMTDGLIFFVLIPEFRNEGAEEG